MDFLKSCKTNIQIAENLLDTDYYEYGIAASDAYDRKRQLYDVIARLRHDHILCASSGVALYTFGRPAPEANRDLELRHSGEVLDEEQEVTADGRTIREVLLGAVEAAVSFKLRESCDVFRIGPWKWLFPGGSDSAGVLLHVTARFTEFGALYTTTSTQSSRLSAVDEDHEPIGDDVVLAPHGRRASLVLEAGNQGLTADSDEWKAMVVAMLRTEGVDIAGESDWMLVKLAGGSSQDCFAWPAQLCLCESVQGAPIRGQQFGSADWRHWFAGADEADGFKHPLAFAEDWFTGAAERNKAALDAATAEVQHDTSDSFAVPSTTAVGMDSILATSPPFIQRIADQQAAMSGMYPTPPDGLAPSHLSSQQPSSDNAAVQGEPSALIHEPTHNDDEADGRQQTASSDPPAYEHANDDLFGDIGGLDFGENEVGDEDFDFFNEEDAESVAGEPRDLDTFEQSLEEEPVAQVLTQQQMPEFNVTPNATGLVQHDPVPRSDESDNVQPLLTTAQQGEQTQQHDDPNSLDVVASVVRKEPQKPLSPLGIRERLLPPPIPASAVQLTSGTSLGHRRSSTFEPVTFRAGLDFGRKYSRYYGPHDAIDFPAPRTTLPDINLPQRRKKPRLKRPPDSDSEVSDKDGESEEDSYESTSSVSDDDLPPKLPWDSRKRKRVENDALPAVVGEFGKMWSDDEAATEGHAELSVDRLLEVFELVISDPAAEAEYAAVDNDVGVEEFALPRIDVAPKGPDKLPCIEELFDLAQLDLIYTAQLVSGQAVSCTSSLVKAIRALSLEDDAFAPRAAAIEMLTHHTLEQVLPGNVDCDITKLALTRDPQARSMSTPNTARPGQPRPPQRSDSVSLGPDVVALPPPYVRVHRGNDTYEMLPPALEFWETLSLSPTSGPKNVRAYCVFPLNDDLQRLVDGFLSDLGNSYESCKLGSYENTRNVDESIESDEYEDGLAPVELSEDDTTSGALRAYGAVCADLGTFLSSVGHLEPDRTIVVFLLNVFTDQTVAHHLCACFWQLYKAYRDNVPRAQRHLPRSDIVLQLLPVELVASPDALVTLDSKQLSTFAKEVYDRCPPSTSMDMETTSALPDFDAPFVELATPPPKRIGFQLAAEPPSDLLHEGSALHVAYAISVEGQWLTVAWVDSTGRYQHNMTFCLCGKSFADVAKSVWEKTREVLATREVTWRVFIVAAGNIDESIVSCWHKVVEKPRKQPFSVTLLSAQLNPGLKLTPTSTSSTDDALSGASAPGAGFLTPATTPQGTAMTVSPDANAQNAPPTPAPSETAVAIAETDPDAHFINLADETWGVIFSFDYLRTSSASSLASGALFKRGAAGLEIGKPGAHLPSMCLNVLWTVQVRPSGNVDEGNIKQAEMTLREVLRMYRNLSVLTDAKGLAANEVFGKVAPVHLMNALKGAEAMAGIALTDNNAPHEEEHSIKFGGAQSFSTSAPEVDTIAGTRLIQQDANSQLLQNPEAATLDMKSLFVHLIAVKNGNTANSVGGKLPDHSILVRGRCHGWVHRPHNLNTTQLLAHPWDLFALGQYAEIPESVREDINAHLSLEIAIPKDQYEALLSRSTSKPKANNSTPPLPQEWQPGQIPQTAIVGPSSDALKPGELRLDRSMVEHLSTTLPSDVALEPVSLFNLFKYKKDRSVHDAYMEDFKLNFGNSAGASIEFMGSVTGPLQSDDTTRAADQQTWDDANLVQYDTVWHYAYMLSTDVYKKLNQQKVAGLNDTCILCVSQAEMSDL